MQKYKYIIILLIFFEPLIYGQNINLLSGKVVDENNKPLVNVNIFLKNSKRGMITNNDGNFSISYFGKKDSITFSYMGYKSYTAEIDSTTKLLKIQLTPALIQLPELLITNLSAEELLDKAISKIPENYSQEEFLANVFYRSSISTQKDSLLYVEETMFEQIKSYKPKFEDKTFLVKNRNFNFLNKEFGIQGIGIYDNVKSLANNGRKRNRNIYNYGIPSFYDGSLTYVIEINKNSEKESVLKGKIFIDVDNLAFVRFELSENKKTQNVQYKKIGTKYYLFSENVSNQNEKQNGGYGNVSAIFVLTEIMQKFEYKDIKGTLINEDDIIRTYANQDYDNSFWKIHNSVLQDSITQRRITKFKIDQGFTFNNPIKKEIETYQKIYYPNLSLRLSTEIPNDINSLSQNSVSINLLTNHFLQKKLKNFYLKLLIPSIFNAYLISPFEEIELERKLLSINGLHTGINPFIFNSTEKSYHYGLSQPKLEKFKTENYPDFMRFHTLRGEYHYLKTKILEEDISKADMSNKNNKNTFLTMYFMDLLYNRTYNIFYSQLKDKTLKGITITKAPLIIDNDKSWVKYLFEHNKTFNSHITSDLLTTEEKKYLKRSAIFSWMNLVSPQMMGIDKFSVTKNLKATFSLNYLRIPFGEMTEQNIWLVYNKQLNGLFFRQYIAKEKTGFGLGYKMYNTKLNKKISLSSSIDYWKQPTNLDFYSKTFENGFHIGQDLEFKFLKEKYSQLNKISFYIGYDYKSAGYLPQSIELQKQFKINFGLKVNL